MFRRCGRRRGDGSDAVGGSERQGEREGGESSGETLHGAMKNNIPVDHGRQNHEMACAIAAPVQSMTTSTGVPLRDATKL